MRTALLLGALVLMVGCTSTSMTLVVDPSAQGWQPRHVVVSVKLADADLDLRIKAENRLVNILRERGVAATALTQIVPPTREAVPRPFLRADADLATVGTLSRHSPKSRGTVSW